MASERFPLKNLRALPAQLRFRRAGLAGFCGAAFGLALARYLFESQPQRLSFLSTWPGALLLAIACGSAALRFGLRQIVSGRLSGGPFLALLLPLLSLLAPDVNLLRAQTLLLGALVLFTLLVLTAESAEERELGGGRWEVGFSLFLFLFLFLLYLLTLAPAVGEADTFEFQVGIARLGVAHGSGYPLLMLLGKLFTLLPVGGTLAFRANLTSAFFGALAGVGVERLARRLGCAPLTALLAGFTFGVSPTLWSRAVEVEAYTLNAVLVAAILYLLLMLVNGSSSVIREASRAQRVGRLPSSVYLLAFLFGLSLTNHLTTLVLTPACLVATLMAASRRRWPMADGRWPMANSTSASGSASHSPRAAVTRSGHASFVIRHSSFVILSLLLGLSVYLYLPLRWPAVNHGEQLSWAQFVNILSGSEARGAFQWALPFQDFNRYEILFRKIVGEYGWAGLALAVLGGAALLVRPSSHPPPSTPHREASPWDAPPFSLHPPLILALAYLGYAYFALAFNVPDPDFSAFLIPLHLIAAVLMGLGLNALLGLAHNFSARLQNRDSSFVTRSGHLSFAILHLSFALLPFRSLWLTLPRVDQSQDWDKYRLGLEILSRLPPQRVGHATILADSERIAPLYYLQVAEGVRPDPDIVVLPDEASYRAALDERLAAGQTVYLARYLPGLGSTYSLRSVGPLAQVSPRPFLLEDDETGPPTYTPLSATLASDIRLLGYHLESPNVPAGDALPLTLFWSAAAPVDGNYLASLRLVDQTGRVAWQSAGSVPVSSLYPTNAWRPGEVISDFYSLPVDFSLAPGDYRLMVGLFPPFQASAAEGWAEVATITISPHARVVGECTVSIDPVELPCAPPREPPSPAHPLRARFGVETGSETHRASLLLGYDAPESAAPGSRFDLTLYWLRPAEVTDVTAFGETRSLAAWPVGSAVPVKYSLTAPASGDQLDLSVSTGEPARCGWLAPVSAGCSLRPVQLAGEAVAEGAINFDNQLVLERMTIDTPLVERGGLAEVTLHWQGLRTMAENYTVFVHLLGPDGLVHGQVDAWPVSGTLPTSQWAPGQTVEDHYRVQVPADAPAGEYQVEVGLYLLATLERLPVLNADGAAVDDRVLMPGLVVK